MLGQNMNDDNLKYRCVKQNCNYIGTRLDARYHVIREHAPLHTVPFYCTLCGYRCFRQKQLENHVTKWHRHLKLSTGSVKDDVESLCKSTTPYEVSYGMVDDGKVDLIEYQPSMVEPVRDKRYDALPMETRRVQPIAVPQSPYTLKGTSSASYTTGLSSQMLTPQSLPQVIQGYSSTLHQVPPLTGYVHSAGIQSVPTGVVAAPGLGGQVPYSSIDNYKSNSSTNSYEKNIGLGKMNDRVAESTRYTQSLPSQDIRSHDTVDRQSYRSHDSYEQNWKSLDQPSDKSRREEKSFEQDRIGNKVERLYEKDRNISRGDRLYEQDRNSNRGDRSYDQDRVERSYEQDRFATRDNRYDQPHNYSSSQIDRPHDRTSEKHGSARSRSHDRQDRSHDRQDRSHDPLRERYETDREVNSRNDERRDSNHGHQSASYDHRDNIHNKRGDSNERRENSYGDRRDPQQEKKEVRRFGNPPRRDFVESQPSRSDGRSDNYHNDKRKVPIRQEVEIREEPSRKVEVYDRRKEDRGDNRRDRRSDHRSPERKEDNRRSDTDRKRGAPVASDSKRSHGRDRARSPSPDRKKAKKDYERSSRHESRDKKVETEHLDDLEEEIPSWIRCSSSDAQFNKANMMFKDTTLVYACTGGRDLHVGLDCDEFHLVPGAILSQLTTEALQRVAQITGHKTIYFIAGIPDFVTTLTSPGYEETIFEDRNLFDSFYSQMRQSDIALQKHNCHVIFSTIGPMSIKQYNDNNKKMNKTYTLRLNKDYEEMQESLHRLLKQINHTIVNSNTGQKLMTPLLHSKFVKRENNRTKFRLDLLLDGLNPCGAVVDSWRKTMNKTMQRNRVLMSKPEFVRKKSDLGTEDSDLPVKSSGEITQVKDQGKCSEEITHVKGLRRNALTEAFNSSESKILPGFSTVSNKYYSYQKPELFCK